MRPKLLLASGFVFLGVALAGLVYVTRVTAKRHYRDPIAEASLRRPTQTAYTPLAAKATTTRIAISTDSGTNYPTSQISTTSTVTAVSTPKPTRTPTATFAAIPTDTSTNLPTPQASTASPPTAASTATAALFLPISKNPDNIVEVEWPARLEVGNSGTIRASIIKVSNGYSPIVEIEGHNAVASTPLPVGTPDSELMSAYGVQYEAYAVAHLAGASYIVALASPESQSLNQSRIDWIWNIASDSPGLQTLDLSIEIEWRQVDNPSKSLKRPIWRSHLEILVFQPLLSVGQISVFSLVSGFVGSGLSIPWILGTIKNRKSQQGLNERERP